MKKSENEKRNRTKKEEEEEVETEKSMYEKKGNEKNIFIHIEATNHFAVHIR